MPERGNTVIGVRGRRVSLRFTISNALPEVNPANIQWFFVSSQREVTQDSRHTFSPNRQTLTINSLVLSDQGNYTFQVNHITGAVTATVFLEIQSQYKL